MSNTATNLPTIAFIGFGEAAQAFVKGWKSEGITPSIIAYDLLLDDRAAAPGKQAECAALGVHVASSAVEAAKTASVVICAVTADQVMQAAESILPAARKDLTFLDLNSAAPFRKTAAAQILAACEVATVDVAVMAPVYPKLHKTPLLISGPGASAIVPVLAALGMEAELVSDKLGDASTVKMVRSIAIKGIESVVMECMTAAVKLGVADRVVPGINDYLANKNFAVLANHVMERVVVHGQRRAAEMREVVATLEAAGVSSYMPAATAAHQQWVADLNLKSRFGGPVPKDGRAIAAALLLRLSSRQAP
jgi:3-hydroxyisobutyrate dehydrogenase-like beta-hydroxyacid dehydrogenase